MRTTVAQFIIVLAFLLSSCVGTVEDKNPKASKSASYGSQEIAFAGANEVIAISNDKVEVYFFPASGSPSDMTYKIYVNNSSTPIEVKGESLQLDQYGQYVYTVTGLRVNTQYSFAVGVKNAKDGSESTTNKTLYTSTFANYTADFTGISKVTPASGDLGKEQVEVEWVPAVSLGTPFAPKPNDPVAYEIRYIAAEDGKPMDLNNPNNPAVVAKMLPTSLGSNPQLSQERKRTIAGLTPGKKYFFMVRAIHKGYVDYSETEPDYKTEQNNKILSVTTLADSGLFDWDASTVKYEIPLGELALTRMDLRWAPAYGPFKNYRVYYIKVGDATENLVDVAAKPDTLDSVSIDAKNAINDYTVVAPDLRSYRISGLDSYAYYKATVVACVTDACADGSRLIGDEVLFRVTPELAPFSGLLEIRDPEDITKLDEIEVRFDPPVVTAGYVNKFELYCFENYDDTNPDELLYNIVSTSAKANCAGLTRITQSPSNLSDYGNYSKIKIKGNFFNASDVISDKTYCFGAIPVVEGTNYVKRNLSAAIIRCKVLKIKVPTKEEFPGAYQACNVGPDNLTAAWDAPSSGIYDRYQVFWREDDGTPFRFDDAVAGSYSSQDGLTTTSYTINGLLPGKKYQYAVLSYIDGATKKYSEYNSGIRTCQIPLPTPRFTEWVDIFAIGPKGDGLVPRRDNSSNGNEKVYLFETLNQHGQPIEVDVQNYFSGNYTPTTGFEDQFASIVSSVNFPGTFGKKGADPAVTYMYQYSNSGIVRLAWKDISFNSGTRTMQDFVDSFETAVLKKDRKFGYKVYRSEDNQKNWVELTSENYSFQTLFNSGLLHPTDYSERLRPNEAMSNYKAVMFTDYSVKHAGTVGSRARARIYYYKVVPVFNGQELRFEREDSNPQHIIKVTLPPENMALVHRLMANRQTCGEIGVAIDNNVANHYSCSWNGVGARGLSVPWVPGSTVYDFGSDLLIDRYELGCNFTRGDYQNVNSKFTPSSYDFLGDSDGGSTFKGCLLTNASLAQRELGSEPAVGDTYTDRHQYRVGDCIGESNARISAGTVTCADQTKANLQYMFLPGLNNNLGLSNCEQSDNLIVNYSDSYNSPPGKIASEVAQSEYGAVYYNRDPVVGSWSYTAKSVRAGGADEATPERLGFRSTYGNYPSRCMINIPVADNRALASGGGRIKHRWLPVNMLDDLVYDGDTANPLNVIGKTMTEVEAMSELFDSTANAVPNSGYRQNSALFRYDPSETPIGRIVSSNDAKLPPLNGLNHDQADSFCSTYKVEVGIYNGATDSFNALQTETSKRMMRRTEGIVAGAHPKTFDETTVTNLENGSRTEAPTGTGGVTFNASCNSFDRGINAGQPSATVQAGLPMSVRMGDKGTMTYSTSMSAAIISGSSFFDYEGDSYSTQSCTSRYGLQDIIGNMEEFSSERIFCNYSGETLMIGTSDQAPGSVIINNGTTYNDNNLEPWVQSDPDTGRCSTIEVGSNRSGTFASGSLLIPQYDFFGNLNTSMIGKSNDVDEYSVSYLRNGDGYYLDFGQGRLSPPVSINDTLALVDEYPVTVRRVSGADDPRRGKYFSPISGFPLECGDTSCDSTTNNRSISTESLRTKFSLPTTAFNVPDYPVGNSLITSDGMSEINKGNGISISATNPLAFTVTYLDSISPSDTYVTSQTNDPLEITVREVWWKVDRGSYLYSRNFGGKNRANRPGRYSANIMGKTSSNQKSSLDAGVRCAVRINEERP